MRIGAFLSACAVVATTGSIAFAQPADRDRAQRFFEAGRKHVKAGRCDLAIEEFKSSIDFEPTSVGARLNLGDCYDSLGRLTEAFRQYKDAEAVAVRAKDPRVDDARRAGARIEARLVRVVLREDEPTLAGVIVKVDGVSLGVRPWTIALAPEVIHTIEAQAPDGRRWREEATGKAGDIVRLSLSLSLPLSSERSSPPLAPSGASATQVSPAPAASVARPEPTHPSVLPMVGYVTLGLGALGLVTGGVASVLALGYKSDLDRAKTAEECRGSICDVSARSSVQPIEDRAFTASTVATVAFVAGGALAIGGAVLVLTAPRPARTSAVRLRLGAGFAIDGTF